MTSERIKYYEERQSQIYDDYREQIKNCSKEDKNIYARNKIKNNSQLVEDFLNELAEEYEYEMTLASILAQQAYKHYRDIEDVEGMQKCSKYLSEEQKKAAEKRIGIRNLEKMMEPPMVLTDEIARILQDPEQREFFKERQKECVRSTIIKRYFEGKL